MDDLTDAGKPLEYVIPVPRSVFARDAEGNPVEEIVLRMAASPKDVALMTDEEIAFGKMLVEPKVSADCHTSFYRFIVSTAGEMLREPQQEAQAQWADRKFDDDGNLTFNYCGHRLVFSYPKPARAREIAAQTRTLDSWRQNKLWLNESLRTPPASIHNDTALYQFCVAISNEIIADGIDQAGEGWAARRTR